LQQSTGNKQTYHDSVHGNDIKTNGMRFNEIKLVRNLGSILSRVSIQLTDVRS